MRKALFILAMFALVLPAYARAGERIRTYPAKAEEIKGAFTLILYGGNYAGDIETAAFLDLEGDGYTFKPNAPAFNYIVKKGLSAVEALHEAEAFVRDHRAYLRYELKSIRDSAGKVLGYEMGPLYGPLVYGSVDVIDISYYVRGDKLVITVWLRPEVERQLRDGVLFERKGRP